MSLQELTDLAESEGIDVPKKATGGALILLLRASKSAPSETVVNFGRYQGFMYKEIPRGYLEWGIQEVQENKNASEDLRRLAAWGREELARLKEKGPMPKKDYMNDPESLAVIPPPAPNESDGATSSATSWSRVTMVSRSSTKGRKAEEMTDEASPEDVREEVRQLENQIAALKKKQFTM